jgi:hypothetical protein
VAGTHRTESLQFTPEGGTPNHGSTRQIELVGCPELGLSFPPCSSPHGPTAGPAPPRGWNQVFTVGPDRGTGWCLMDGGGHGPCPQDPTIALSAPVDRNLSGFSEKMELCPDQVSNPWSAPILVRCHHRRHGPQAGRKVLGSGTSGRLRFPNPATSRVRAEPDGFVTADSARALDRPVPAADRGGRVPDSAHPSNPLLSS